jgi:hypothetical protein
MSFLSTPPSFTSLFFNTISTTALALRI